MKSIVMRSVMAAAVLAAAGAAPGVAMQMEDGVLGVASLAPAPSERAEALKTEAESLYSQPKQWRKAARLLEQSAQLREAVDPQAYSCWVYAARLRSSIGDFTGALENLERAAAHALARGAVIDAAHAYIDAAHVAVRARHFAEANELVDRAKLLATSPQLQPDEAAQITSRLRA